MSFISAPSGRIPHTESKACSQAPFLHRGLNLCCASMQASHHSLTPQLLLQSKFSPRRSPPSSVSNARAWTSATRSSFFPSLCTPSQQQKARIQTCARALAAEPAGSSPDAPKDEPTPPYDVSKALDPELIARKLLGEDASGFSKTLDPPKTLRDVKESDLPPVPRLTLYQSVRTAVLTLLGLATAVAAVRAVLGIVLSPSFLLYVTWLLAVWPVPAAVVLGAATVALAAKQGKRGGGKMWEQVVLLVGALTWLVLVPCGIFQGYVDGWPLVLFCVYCFFFSISSIIRQRLHGDLSPRQVDKQWATPISRAAQIAFIFCVVGGHWLAAREASSLALPSFWPDNIARLLMFFAVWQQWDAAWFLGKSFDRVVAPQVVVTVGPYRFARHPIYGSYMLLFASYCVALRSWYSLLFILAGCLAYYLHRTQLEEELLVENFGEEYENYRKRVPQRFFPFLF